MLLYNSAGTLVANSGSTGSNGGNAPLSYNVPAAAGGIYYLQVIASPLTSEPTTGDYVLTFSGEQPDHVPVLTTSGTLSLLSVSDNPSGDFGTLVENILATGATINDPDPARHAGHRHHQRR